jgi:hypothetical protein
VSAAATDPVCHIPVDELTAAGRLVRGGGATISAQATACRNSRRKGLRPGRGRDPRLVDAKLIDVRLARSDAVASPGGPRAPGIC